MKNFSLNRTRYSRNTNTEFIWTTNFDFNIIDILNNSNNASSSYCEKPNPLLSINKSFSIVNVTYVKPLLVQEVGKSIDHGMFAAMKSSFLQNKMGFG